MEDARDPAGQSPVCLGRLGFVQLVQEGKRKPRLDLEKLSLPLRVELYSEWAKGKAFGEAWPFLYMIALYPHSSSAG